VNDQRRTGGDKRECQQGTMCRQPGSWPSASFRSLVVMRHGRPPVVVAAAYPAETSSTVRETSHIDSK